MELALQIIASGATILAIIGWTLRHGLREQIVTQQRITTEVWQEVKSNREGLAEINLAHTACSSAVSATLLANGRELGEIKDSLKRVEKKIDNGYKGSN